MNKKLVILIELLVISSMIIGCLQKKVTLSLKMKEGDRFSLEYLSEDEINTELEELISFNKFKKEVKYNCEVKAIDENNYYVINAKLDSIVLYLSSKKGLNIEFSSQLANQSDDIFSLFLASLIDKSFEVYVGQNGKVDKIIGLDKIVEDGLAIIENKNDENIEDFKKIIFQEFSSQSLKQKLNNVNTFYNGEDVKEGDIWPKESELKMLTELMIKNEYKLEAIGDSSSKIKLSGEIKSAEDSEPIVIGENNYELALEGKQEGEIIIDGESSLVKEYNVDYSLTGKIKITSENPEKGAQEVPISIKGKQEISTRK